MDNNTSNDTSMRNENESVKAETNETDIDLDEFTPLIPDVVLDHLLERNGIDCVDKETKKTISLMAQKFITDVATSAFQFHKIHQKAAQKDKRFSKEKKLTLNMLDLEKALEEYGINVSRPHYFM